MEENGQIFADFFDDASPEALERFREEEKVYQEQIKRSREKLLKLVDRETRRG